MCREEEQLYFLHSRLVFPLNHFVKFTDLNYAGLLYGFKMTTMPFLSSCLISSKAGLVFNGLTDRRESECKTYI